MGIITLLKKDKNEVNVNNISMLYLDIVQGTGLLNIIYHVQYN